MPSKIFLIAGEASGDAHGARLVRALKSESPAMEFHGLGGSQMMRSGVRILTDLTRISAVGLTDVLNHYFTFRKIFYEALRQVRELKPDAVILIDFPGFNLRFAKKLNRSVPVLYYISPQIWAWGGRRIRTIKKFVDKLLVFFPFEKELYDSAGIESVYIGHPLVDEIKGPPSLDEIASLRKEFFVAGEPVLGLLPGSREKEVKRILPLLLQGALLLSKKYPQVEFLLAESNTIQESIYHDLIAPYRNSLKIRVVRGRSYDVIKASDGLAVASGTATLETALHGKPFFLVYKAAWLSYFLARMLIRIPYLGIVNVLANRKLVPELIQWHMTPNNVMREMDRMLKEGSGRDELLGAFLELRKKLSAGNAVQLAAKELIRLLPAQTPTTVSSKKI